MLKEEKAMLTMWIIMICVCLLVAFLLFISKLTRKLKIPFMAVALLICAGMIGTVVAGVARYSKTETPFWELQRVNIHCIDVTYGIWPGYTISEEDTEKVISTLRKAKIRGNPANDWKDANGRSGEKLLLYFNDGSILSIEPFGSILIIDEVGYVSDYSLVQELEDICYSYAQCIIPENAAQYSTSEASDLNTVGT